MDRNQECGKEKKLWRRLKGLTIKKKKGESWAKKKTDFGIVKGEESEKHRKGGNFRRASLCDAIGMKKATIKVRS